LADEALGALVAAQLAPQQLLAPAPLLHVQWALRDRLQQLLAEHDDISKVAQHICRSVSELPGVVRCALFLMTPGELRLEAQAPADGQNLGQLLGGADNLLDSPMRHAFPGLVAACSGQMALLDAPAKGGQPELAIDLLDNGIQMVLGVPLPPGRLGAARGALCLMFARARTFSGDELRAFTSLAQLAGLGLAMAATTGENAQLMGRLTHLATIDALTGVANRRHGEHLLEGEIRRARRYQVPLALIAFDVDRFRAVNDQFGHPVGDAALRTLADSVQAGLRGSDVLVRTSGAQFAIIAPHTNAGDGLRMAEKIRSVIAQTDIAGCDRLTISLGVAQLSELESADALVLRADAALARAKRAGRNCVELAMR
jgi:diguanylate cyclase (GGDEF)-like protein